MENMFLMLAIVFIVGALIGVKFIFGLLRYFPMFPIFSFGRQERTGKQENSSGGSAIGSTMIFVFLLSFAIMFMYFERKVEDVAQATPDRFEPAPELDEEPDLGIPRSIDPNDPQTRYDNELKYVEHNLPAGEPKRKVTEFQHGISSVDRGASTQARLPENLRLFYFQVAASSRKANALEKAEEMKRKTDKGVFLGEQISRQSLPYKILIGPFEDKADAKKFGKRLRLDGFAIEAKDLQLFKQ